MQFLKCFALLVTALPAALSSVILPQEDLCKPGSRRCYDNNLEECSSHGNFELFQKCTETEFCTIDVVDPDARGQCLQQDCIQEPCPGSSPIGSPDAPASCVDGESHCEGKVIQKCENGNWISDLTCPKPSTCVVLNDIAQCRTAPPPRPNPELCIPGDRKCSADAYAVLLCGENKQYRIEKKCATPGDCKTDGPGQAHCERGSMDPPISKSIEGECNHGDSACDTNRRYLFQCLWGKWEYLQCHRANACQIDELDGRLSCTGFPLYKYPDEDVVCETERSCEIMEYLQCKGSGTDDHRRMAECVKAMCSTKGCEDCDRCIYRNVIPQPDMSTLVPGPKNGTMKDMEASVYG